MWRSHSRSTILEARIHNLVEMRKLLREKFSQTPLEPINTIAPNPVDDQFLTQLTNIIEENFSNPSCRSISLPTAWA